TLCLIVHFLVHNLKIAKRLGFEGMLVLHPKELELVHKYFSPAEEEVEAAKKMVNAFEDSEKNGLGVAIVEGKFVGPPLVKNAFKVLDKHNKISKK
ncbi:MAG: hypothetical protein ACTHVL_01285, partial [Lacticaseibacillus paracasei]